MASGPSSPYTKVIEFCSLAPLRSGVACRRCARDRSLASSGVDNAFQMDRKLDLVVVVKADILEARSYPTVTPPSLLTFNIF